MYSVKYHPGLINWNKIEKPSKIGQDKKSLISIFAFFLTAIAKVWALGCLHPNLKFF